LENGRELEGDFFNFPHKSSSLKLSGKKRDFFCPPLDRVQVQGTAVFFQSPTARRQQRRDEQTGGI